MQLLDASPFVMSSAVERLTIERDLERSREISSGNSRQQRDVSTALDMTA
jgi:hypothetical protein